MKKLSNDKILNPQLILFSFVAPTARLVSLVGDFNDWNPKVLMDKGIDGVWYLRVALKPGDHEYRFIADGIWQDDPAAQKKVFNSIGGENCVKIVHAEIMAAPSISRGITL